MTRPEKVARAQELRAEGLTFREIGERLGVGRSTADRWINDPDRLQERERRRNRYSTPCIDCGKPTDGSGGFAVTVQRCIECHARHLHEARHWTPERVIAALQAWAQELGHPPTSQMGLRGGAPIGTSIVQREFGTWSAGCRAAGLPAHRRGRPPKVAA